MERKKSSRRAPELEYSPELIQHVQSFLSYREAIRSCVLSKAWLQAWSTIPTLRLHQPNLQFPPDDPPLPNPAYRTLRREFVKLVDETLKRYHRENLLIEKFDLLIDIRDHESDSIVEKWLQVASNGRLEELSLRIVSGVSQSLEVFSCKTLKKVSLKGCFWMPLPVVNSPEINCHLLVVLVLSNVYVNEMVLQKLISCCHLIEKITLEHCMGFRRIEVKRLDRLREFCIRSQHDLVVVVKDAPSLWKFECYYLRGEGDFPLTISSLKRLTYLHLHGLNIKDDVFNTMILEFPLLECLIIGSNSSLKLLNIRCMSLNRLMVSDCNELEDVKVHAPNLQRFDYGGHRMPDFSFQNISKLLEATLQLKVDAQLDNSAFRKLREAVKISSMVSIVIVVCPSIQCNNIDIEGLLTTPFPSEIQKLCIFDGSTDWEDHLAFVDAFLSVFHPKLVIVYPLKLNESLWKFLLKELMERPKTSCRSFCDRMKCWHHYLENVEVWVHNGDDSLPLTNSWGSLLDGSKGLEKGSFVKFQLDWQTL